MPSGDVKKLLLVGCGVMVLVTGVAIYGVWYASGKIRALITGDESAQSDSGRGAVKQSAAEGRDLCALWTAAEASAVLGFPVIRTESGGPPSQCSYFVAGQPVAEAAKAEAERQMNQAKKNDADPQQFAQSILKGLATAGSADPNAEIRALRVTLRTGEDGASSMAGLRGASKLMEGATKGIPGLSVAEKLSGLGDEALISGISGILMVRQGSSYLELETGPIPESRDKLIQAARALLSKL